MRWLVGVFIVFLVLFLWYRFVGWTSFNFIGGQRPSWKSSKNCAALRFRNVIFTVNINGTGYSRDVTDVLDNMAAAYKESATTLTGLTQTLSLSPPKLDAVSFVLYDANKNIINGPGGIFTRDVLDKAQVRLTGSVRGLVVE